MPYIEPNQREKIDPLIDDLIRMLRALDKDSGRVYAGLLNYACTRLALGVVPERRYVHIATVTGVFQNIITEFYRRYAVPYEEEKMSHTGDVYPEATGV